MMKTSFNPCISIRFLYSLHILLLYHDSFKTIKYDGMFHRQVGNFRHRKAPPKLDFGLTKGMHINFKPNKYFFNHFLINELNKLFFRNAA